MIYKRSISAVLGLLCAGTLCADTLKLQDGRTLSGEVTRVGNAYIVKRPAGEIRVAVDEVVEYIKDAPKPEVKPPVKPPDKPGPEKPPVDTPGVKPVKPNVEDLAKKASRLAERLKQGQDALAAGQSVVARDRFLEAVDIDKNSVKALHGLALSYLGVKDIPRAKQNIERAYFLASGAASKQPLDRTVVINYALIQISNGTAGRALKPLCDYMRGHPKPIDEGMLNALAITLQNVHLKEKKDSKFTDAVILYEQVNARLEATRPSERRWGLAWTSSDDWNKLDIKYRALLAPLGEQEEKLSRWTPRIAQMKAELAEYRRQFDLGNVTGAQLRSVEDEADYEFRAYDRAMATYLSQKAKADAIGPEFPTVLLAVSLDELTPPAKPVVALSKSLDPDAIAEADTLPPIVVRNRQRRPLPPVTSTDTPIPSGTDNKPKPPDKTKPPMIDEPDPLANKPPEIKVPKQAGVHMVRDEVAAVPIGPQSLLTVATPAVRKASKLTVTDKNGNDYEAELARIDDATGLALLKVKAKTLRFVGLNDTFTGGKVSAVFLGTVSIFDDVSTEATPGNFKLETDGGTFTPEGDKHPTGSPLVANSRIVGLLVDGNNAVITAAQIRAAFAADLPADTSLLAVPTDVVCRVTAMYEEKVASE